MARLDQVLVEKGLFLSREKAQRAILAGAITVNGQTARKSSDSAKPNDLIEVKESEKFVSRGGQKLEHALNQFSVVVTDLIAMDVGASTGGFTDCLLQRGAQKVYAVDVGKGQLAWKLRQDPRVVVMEKTNARDLTPHSFPQPFIPFGIAVVDCSFISLTKILPPVVPLVSAIGKIVCLIKPQFEAGKTEVDKGAGVIKNPAIHERVIKEIQTFCTDQLHLRWTGLTESPILGPAGNKEFLLLLERS
ncbi:MAG: hemolysin [Verrucomicrobiales bacterium]|nr:hemolysin [Verrucomicrobiales bacterium]